MFCKENKHLTTSVFKMFFKSVAFELFLILRVQWFVRTLCIAFSSIL